MQQNGGIGRAAQTVNSAIQTEFDDGRFAGTRDWRAGGTAPCTFATALGG